MTIRILATAVACVLGVACAAPVNQPGTSADAVGGKADQNPHEHVADSFLHFTLGGERAHFTALPAAPRAVGSSPDHAGESHAGVSLMQMWIDEDEVASMLPMGTPQVSLLVRMDPEIVEPNDPGSYLRDYFGANFYFRSLRIIDVRAGEHTPIETMDIETIHGECVVGARLGLYGSEVCGRLFPTNGAEYLVVSGDVPALDVFDHPGSTWAIELVDRDRLDDPGIAIVAMRVSFDVKAGDAVSPNVDVDSFEQTLPSDELFGGEFDGTRASVQQSAAD